VFYPRQFHGAADDDRARLIAHAADGTAARAPGEQDGCGRLRSALAEGVRLTWPSSREPRQGGVPARRV
jgi:hypothetical protein